ncbi:hypothetical protein [Micromonospora sp. NPDC049645]|uniref:hypothetical protein n=1 Tax=Micromonospora sp. NPDC049645 TaxID=3155508 RepID=UPI003446F180
MRGPNAPSVVRPYIFWYQRTPVSARVPLGIANSLIGIEGFAVVATIGVVLLAGGRLPPRPARRTAPTAVIEE